MAVLTLVVARARSLTLHHLRVFSALLFGLRASREEEIQGLDVPEHGIEAYPEEEPVKA